MNNLISTVSEFFQPGSVILCLISPNSFLGPMFLKEIIKCKNAQYPTPQRYVNTGVPLENCSVIFHNTQRQFQSNEI